MDMTRLLALPACVAAAGTIVTGLIHVAAWFGLRPLGEPIPALFVVLFAVWVPAVLTANSLTSEFKRRDFWKAALRGAPTWTRWLVFGLFVYAIVNFTLAIVLGTDLETNPAARLRLFSGHL